MRGIDGNDEDLVDGEVFDIHKLLKIDDPEKVKRIYVHMRQKLTREKSNHDSLQRKLVNLKAELDRYSEKPTQIQLATQDDDTPKFQELEERGNILAQEDRIRDRLSEVLYAKPSGGKVLETVKISFRRDSTRFNLAFHVEQDTKVSDLYKSACRYWDVPTGQYVLLTMAGNKCQDALYVRECFKPGDIAQLRLEKKKLLPQEKATEAELKATKERKPPRKRKNKNQQHADQPGYDAAGVNPNRDRHEEAKQFGGVYFLLKTPPRKPSEHCAKIKLHDILVYIALAVLTFYTYQAQRPDSTDFWLQSAFEVEITKKLIANEWIKWEVTDSGTADVPSLLDVRTLPDTWAWLNYTLPSIIFPFELKNNLHDHNSLFGYATIRVQNTKADGQDGSYCKHNQALVGNLTAKGAVCHPVEVSEQVQETADLTALKSYWDEVVANQAAQVIASRLRGPTEPWKFADARHNEEMHGIGRVKGDTQGFDASGYSVEYNMGIGGLIGRYQTDISELRRVGWISPRTRCVIVSFTAYNKDLDMWVATDVIFELLPADAVQAKYYIRLFRPNIFETKLELSQAYIDYIRLVLAFYVGVFVGIMERQHKIKNRKAGCWYHLTVHGISDLGIVVCVLTVLIWRQTALNGPHTEDHIKRATDQEWTQGFQSFSNIGYAYMNILCVEGVLFIFLMFRLITFGRLSRRVYLLWHAMGIALKELVVVMVVFCPTVWGIMSMMHAAFGSYFREYSLLPSTLFQFFFMLEGDVDFQPLLEVDAIWTAVIVTIVYLLIYFVLLNVILVVVVDANYVAHLTSSPGEKWSTARRLKFFIPAAIVNLFPWLPSSAESS